MMTAQLERLAAGLLQAADWLEDANAIIADLGDDDGEDCGQMRRHIRDLRVSVVEVCAEADGQVMNEPEKVRCEDCGTADIKFKCNRCGAVTCKACSDSYHNAKFWPGCAYKRGRQLAASVRLPSETAPRELTDEEIASILLATRKSDSSVRFEGFTPDFQEHLRNFARVVRRLP